MSASKFVIIALHTSLLALTVACGDGGEDTSAGSGGTSASAELTLDNCPATVGADVPNFYKTYFKCSDIELSGENVIIHSRGLPPHQSYYYGTGSANYTAFDTSRGADYAPNPNHIAELDITLTVPLEPTAIADNAISADRVDGMMGTDAGEYRAGPAGVALDSVMLYNAVAAAGMDIENEMYTFDSYEAHPDMNGRYHYHAPSMGPLEVLVALGEKAEATVGSSGSELYGIMCDGTVVLGCTELDGSTPDASDFDAQNGHVHDLSDGTATLITQRYHVHLCHTLDPMRHFTPEIQYYEACDVNE